MNTLRKLILEQKKKKRKPNNKTESKYKLEINSIKSVLPIIPS